MEMTPALRIKRELILMLAEGLPGDWEAPPLDTPEQIQSAWYACHDDIKLDDALHDMMGDFREGDEFTTVPCESSRHYESRSVARKLRDGTWVGWTYWYGGGKHGEPESIDWMGDAYLLDVTEEEKLVTVRTWRKL